MSKNASKARKNVRFAKFGTQAQSQKLNDMKNNLIGTSNAIYGKGETLNGHNSMKILEEES
jgi:hypothetical protein